MRTDRSVLAALLAVVAAACASTPRDPLVAYDLPGRVLAIEPGAPRGATGTAHLGLQSGADERPARVTVEEAVAEAIHANRVVMQARVGAAIGAEDERIARAALLPSAGARYSYTNIRDPQRIVISGGSSFTSAPDQINAFGANLDFPIFAFGRHLNSFRAARLARQRSEADRDTAESDIAAAVTAAAFDVLEGIAAIDVAKSTEEALRQQVQDSQALFDAGSVTKVALLEASVEYDTAVRSREKLESAVPILRMRLNTLLGRPPAAPIEVVDDRETRAPVWKLEALVDEAVARRPELRAAGLDAAAAERALRAQVGAEIGEVRGNVAWETTDNPFLSPQETLTFLLTFDIPIFTAGARGARIRRARHELDIAELRAREAEDSIRTEVADALRNVIEAFRDIPVAQSSVERAEESLRIQREKFKNGRATSREVLDTTALLTNSRLSLVRAIYAYKVALRELHRARGADPAAAPFAELEEPPPAEAE